MLLVDDDQADLLQRREHRRARADAHPGLPRAQPLPFVVALPPRERRVEHRDDVSEAFLEPRGRLRGEADLGYEHDRRASGAERLLDRAQVNLGLARTGDAVEQEPVLTALSQPRQHVGERPPLSVGELSGTRSLAEPGARRRGPAALGPMLERHQPASLEPPQQRRAERRGDGRAAVPQPLERDPLAIGQLLGAQERLAPPLGAHRDERLAGPRRRSPSPARASAPAPARESSRSRRPATGRARPGRAGRRPRAPPGARRAGPARAPMIRPARRPRRASCGARTGPAAASRPRPRADRDPACSRTGPAPPGCW